MAEPKDMVIPMLKELRDEMRLGFAAVDRRFDELDQRVNTRFDRIEKRQDAQKDAFAGESILGRYAIKEVDERLAALERDVAELRARS